MSTWLQGFFYELNVPGDLSTAGKTKSNQTDIQSRQIWYHVVGTDQSQDMCLLSFPGKPVWYAVPEYTEDFKCAPHLPGKDYCIDMFLAQPLNVTWYPAPGLFQSACCMSLISYLTSRVPTFWKTVLDHGHVSTNIGRRSAGIWAPKR